MRQSHCYDLPHIALVNAIKGFEYYKKFLDRKYFEDFVEAFLLKFNGKITSQGRTEFLELFLRNISEFTKQQVCGLLNFLTEQLSGRAHEN